MATLRTPSTRGVVLLFAMEAAACSATRPAARAQPAPPATPARPPRFASDLCSCLRFASDPPDTLSLLAGWSRRTVTAPESRPASAVRCFRDVQRDAREALSELQALVGRAREERDVVVALALVDRATQLTALAGSVDEHVRQRARAGEAARRARRICGTFSQRLQVLVREGAQSVAVECACERWMPNPAAQLLLGYPAAPRGLALLRVRASIDGLPVLDDEDLERLAQRGASASGLLPGGAHRVLSEVTVRGPEGARALQLEVPLAFGQARGYRLRVRVEASLQGARLVPELEDALRAEASP